MHRTNDVLAQPGPRATLRLSEVLSALTRAFDITEGMLPGHATRTCYIAMRISRGAQPHGRGTLPSLLTGSHSYNVALVAEAMARRLGLDDGRTRTVRWAALVHDLGKLGVPNTILDKPGPLAEEEIVVMRRHPLYTHEILSRVPALAEVGELAASHHEQLDGHGYFRGLVAEQLPLSARVIAVADVLGSSHGDAPVPCCSYR